MPKQTEGLGTRRYILKLLDQLDSFPEVRMRSVLLALVATILPRAAIATAIAMALVGSPDPVVVRVMREIRLMVVQVVALANGHDPQTVRLFSSVDEHCAPAREVAEG